MATGWTYPEPLESLKRRAGDTLSLRDAMGGVPQRTFYRWVSIIRSFGTEALPRSAKYAINQADTLLPKKEQEDEA